MTIDEKIRDGNAELDLNKEAAKKLSSSLDKINSNKQLRDEEILTFDQSQSNNKSKLNLHILIQVKLSNNKQKQLKIKGKNK